MKARFRELKRAGLNPRYRTLKDDIRLAGGPYPPGKKGGKVLVYDAANQPRWKEEEKVFIEWPGCGCEILIRLSENVVDK